MQTAGSTKVQIDSKSVADLGGDRWEGLVGNVPIGRDSVSNENLKQLVRSKSEFMCRSVDPVLTPGV